MRGIKPDNAPQTGFLPNNNHYTDLKICLDQCFEFLPKGESPLLGVLNKKR